MMEVSKSRAAAVYALIALASVLSGCATSSNPKDPIEAFNRGVYNFNDTIDKAVLKPVAQGYDSLMPVRVKTGVSNFFGNIDDVFIGVNDLLQCKVKDALSDGGRVVINSTIGIVGLVDFASDFGLEKHEEDFGLTFGHWGMGPGAYVVVPFKGPRDVRDTAGMVLDMVTDPVAGMHNVAARNSFLVTRVVSDRTNLLPAEKVIDEAALDKYSYMRDAYLQRRRNLVYDGSPPHDDDE